MLCSPDLRASPDGVTLWPMFDPIPILLAREHVRAGIHGPAAERRPGRAHPRLAALLRRLADRIDGPAIACGRPAGSPAR
jgi:hypothetical protein